MPSSRAAIPPTNPGIMAIVPKNPADQVRFYAAHVPVWSVEGGTIGLSSAITAGLTAKLAAAETAYREALEIRNAAEAATLRYRDAVRQLHGKGSAAIATIKAFASVSNDALVYSRAQIDPPSTARAAPPPPGAPSVSSATVDSVGTLNLEWSAAHGESVGPSSGVYFEVYRRRTGLNEHTPTLIGTTAGLTLRDPDIGPGQNTYTVRARRGTHTGPLSIAVSVTLPDRPGAIDAEPSVAAAPPRSLRRAA